MERADTLSVNARAALEQDWLTLTRVTLPAFAKERNWPVRFDHCFQRILLDNACGGVWYNVITKRPAYAHAPEDILQRAIALGQGCISGMQDMHALNKHSLHWRKKGG